jgi:toxin-antitoxin system PIN domain toxin
MQTTIQLDDALLAQATKLAHEKGCDLSHLIEETLRDKIAPSMLVARQKPFRLTTHVLSGFLRVVTHPRVFSPPSSIRAALDFARQVREQPNRRVVAPGSPHWQIFTGLCQSLSAAGNLVPDVWFAALAIESDCEWITTDRAYERFPGLRCRHPFAGTASE